jgi:AraC-like DNA-binding protein
VDTSTAIAADDIRTGVAAAMDRGLIREAADALGRLLSARVGAPTPEMLLANDMARMLMTDSSIVRVEDAAARLAVSVRTMQRLAHRSVGLPPAAMIRRRRLQEAAQRVREHPDVSLATIAAELGYADHAHLANDFRTVLGFTPSQYRAG